MLNYQRVYPHSKHEICEWLKAALYFTPALTRSERTVVGPTAPSAFRSGEEGELKGEHRQFMEIPAKYNITTTMHDMLWNSECLDKLIVNFF